MGQKTDTGKDTTEVDVKRDQAFKSIIKDRDILAALLKGVVPEFKNLDKEEIIECLPLEVDGRTVVGRNVESPSVYNGPIFLDSVFDVKSPVKGDLSLIVAIEAQGRSMAESDLYNREQYYSCRLVSDQGMLYKTKKELYANLKKTVVIWVMLASSGKDKNTIVRDYRSRESSYAPGVVKPSPLNKTEIYEIHVGEYLDSVTEPILRILNTLFSSKLQGEDKADVLLRNYDIDVSDTIIEEADLMGALAEEMEMVREEGREEGSERKLSELVEFYVEYVAKKMSETGKTAEVIMSDLPILPECYDRVLETLARKG
ncbi:MAG: hypothetical protein J5945_02495 [Candidatus Methanomethylophilus sp.]|nr:hypothetical protein [Methanomethylophilus sp.]